MTTTASAPTSAPASMRAKILIASLALVAIVIAVMMAMSSMSSAGDSVRAGISGPGSGSSCVQEATAQGFSLDAAASICSS